MAGDHGASETEQLFNDWTRGRREKRVAEEQTAQRVRSWIVQNETRSILGRMAAGAVCRILNFANFKEARVNRRLCPLQRT